MIYKFYQSTMCFGELVFLGSVSTEARVIHIASALAPCRLDSVPDKEEQRVGFVIPDLCILGSTPCF